MRRQLVVVLMLVLSLGVLGACGGSGNNNANSNTSNTSNTSNDANSNSSNTPAVNSAAPISSLTPAETVLLFADICTARDLQSLTDLYYGFNDMSWNFNDDDDETFVEMVIVVQNPSAQMEPYEIEYYQSMFPDLLNTAIVCAEETSIYRIHATGEPNNYVQYVDYYLVSTQDHPDWRVVYITPQAGY